LSDLLGSLPAARLYGSGGADGEEIEGEDLDLRKR
jgi:hypothetical protein